MCQLIAEMVIPTFDPLKALDVTEMRGASKCKSSKFISYTIGLKYFSSFLDVINEYDLQISSPAINAFAFYITVCSFQQLPQTPLGMRSNSSLSLKAWVLGFTPWQPGTKAS